MSRILDYHIADNQYKMSRFLCHFICTGTTELNKQTYGIGYNTVKSRGGDPGSESKNSASATVSLQHR